MDQVAISVELKDTYALVTYSEVDVEMVNYPYGVVISQSPMDVVSMVDKYFRAKYVWVPHIMSSRKDHFSFREKDVIECLSSLQSELLHEVSFAALALDELSSVNCYRTQVSKNGGVGVIMDLLQTQAPIGAVPDYIRIVLIRTLRNVLFTRSARIEFVDSEHCGLEFLVWALNHFRNCFVCMENTLYIVEAVTGDPETRTGVVISGLAQKLVTLLVEINNGHVVGNGQDNNWFLGADLKASIIVSLTFLAKSAETREDLGQDLGGIDALVEVARMDNDPWILWNATECLFWLAMEGTNNAILNGEKNLFSVVPRLLGFRDNELTIKTLQLVLKLNQGTRTELDPAWDAWFLLAAQQACLGSHAPLIATDSLYVLYDVARICRPLFRAKIATKETIELLFGFMAPGHLEFNNDHLTACELVLDLVELYSDFLVDFGARTFEYFNFFMSITHQRFSQLLRPWTELVTKVLTMNGGKGVPVFLGRGLELDPFIWCAEYAEDRRVMRAGFRALAAIATVAPERLVEANELALSAFFDTTDIEVMEYAQVILRAQPEYMGENETFKLPLCYGHAASMLQLFVAERPKQTWVAIPASAVKQKRGIVAHQFIIEGRCPALGLFAMKEKTVNKKKMKGGAGMVLSVELSRPVDETCWLALLEYVYTGTVVSVGSRGAGRGPGQIDMDDIVLLAFTFGLSDFSHRVDMVTRARSKSESVHSRIGVPSSFMFSSETLADTGDVELVPRYSLVEECARFELTCPKILNTETKLLKNVWLQRRRSAKVHWDMLIVHSNYFQRQMNFLLDTRNGRDKGKPPMGVPFEGSAETLSVFVAYLYKGWNYMLADALVRDRNLALRVLFAADFYMMPYLVAQVESVLYDRHMNTEVEKEALRVLLGHTAAHRALLACQMT